MNKKRWLVAIILGVLAAALAALFYYAPLIWHGQQPATEAGNSAGAALTPPPLVQSAAGKAGSLSKDGIIAQTNLQRQDNGNLPPLKENGQLDSAAAAKLQDLFQRQYFEHVSPDGKGPADLARDAGYAYLMVGENLALGNFGSDQELVDAWMNSPGHRANILRADFSEIGAAAAVGQYQGRETWIAVQEFGRPQSSCPAVDEGLKAQITSLQAQTDALAAELAAEKAVLDKAAPQTQQETGAYNAQVADYNNRIKIYDNQVDVLKGEISRYNAAVSAHNACLSE